MKIEPLIVVENVAESSRFYQNILECDSGHGGDEYEMLVKDGELLLQLHAQDAHDHPGMYTGHMPVGNGVLLWFRTSEFDRAVERVKRFSPEIVADVHVNPNAQQHEIWFKDPNGYVIVFSDNFGDARQTSSN